MSTFIARFEYAFFFLTLLVLSTPVVALKSVPSATPTDIQRTRVESLANKKDLTVKEWLAFARSLDNKCENEQNQAAKESLCELYYEIYKIEELFIENPEGPSQDDCAGYLLTAKSISGNKRTNVQLEKIVEKLCPRK